MNIYGDLFLTFAKVGVCTFGGGYAMLPILQREIVEKRHWATEAELNDYFAIGQCTPGIIAVNTATFVGASQKGALGGLLATLGVIFPSILIIAVIAACLANFQDIPLVQHAFAGIRACVCILILNAVIKLRRSSVIDVPTAIMAVVVFFVSAIFGFSPVILVLVCGVLGLSLHLLKRGRTVDASEPCEASSSVAGEDACSLDEPVSSEECFGEPVSSEECFNAPVSSEECFNEPVSSEECFGEPVSSEECFGAPVSSDECFESDKNNLDLQKITEEARN